MPNSQKSFISIIVASGLGIFFAPPAKLEDMDERDQLIANKGYKIGFIVLSSIMVFLIGAAYIDAFSPDSFSRLEFSPFAMGNILLIAVTLATLCKDTASLYFYRKSF